MENETTNKKDFAKEKIILFVIGTLTGAIIATAAFFVYTKTLGTDSNNSGTSSQQMPGGTPPEMPSGENSQGGTPPARPGEETDSSSQNNSSADMSESNNSGNSSTQKTNNGDSSQSNS